MNVPAASIATVSFAFVAIVYATDGLDTNHYPEYVMRVRQFLGPRGRAILRPIVLGLTWPFMYFYSGALIVPRLPQNAIMAAIVVLVGIGFGVSIGRHIVDTEYSAFGGLHR